MASGSITPDAYQNAKGDLTRLTVVQLKSVVRGDGLALSGSKSTLQDRVKQSELTHLQVWISKVTQKGMTESSPEMDDRLIVANTRCHRD